MNETMIVYGVVLGAACYVGWRYLPASLRARLTPGSANGSSCASKSSCGSKDCDGCH